MVRGTDSEIVHGRRVLEKYAHTWTVCGTFSDNMVIGWIENEKQVWKVIYPACFIYIWIGNKLHRNFAMGGPNKLLHLINDPLKLHWWSQKTTFSINLLCQLYIYLPQSFKHSLGTKSPYVLYITFPGSYPKSSKSSLYNSYSFFLWCSLSWDM